jgi:hypothetical protein
MTGKENPAVMIFASIIFMTAPSAGPNLLQELKLYVRIGLLVPTMIALSQILVLFLVAVYMFVFHGLLLRT